MGGEDPIAVFLPWYANGTLEPEERRLVDAHLPECSSCRELLEQARTFREVGKQQGHETLLDHVNARLLHDHVVNPEHLVVETTVWIRSHLDACIICRQVEAIITDLECARSRPKLSAWERLSRTLLHPVPALAYLLILFVGAGHIYLLEFSNPIGQGPLVVPEAVRLFGETTFRRPGETPLEPSAVPVSWSAGDDPLHLMLMTGLMPSELEDESTVLVLTLSQNGRTFWSKSILPNAVGEHGGIGVLIPLDDLNSSHDYDLVLRIVQPGGDLDNQVAFRQRFHIR